MYRFSLWSAMWETARRGFGGTGGDIFCGFGGTGGGCFFGRLEVIEERFVVDRVLRWPKEIRPATSRAESAEREDVRAEVST